MQLAITAVRLRSHSRSQLVDCDLLAAWPSLPQLTPQQFFGASMGHILAIVPVPGQKSTIIVDTQRGVYRIKVAESYLMGRIQAVGRRLSTDYDAELTKQTKAYKLMHHTTHEPKPIILGSAVFIGCAADNHRPNVELNGQFYSDVHYFQSDPQRMAIDFKWATGACQLVCQYPPERHLDQSRMKQRFQFAETLAKQTWPQVLNHHGVLVDTPSKPKTLAELTAKSPDEAAEAEREMHQFKYFLTNLHKTGVPQEFHRAIIALFQEALAQP